MIIFTDTSEHVTAQIIGDRLRRTVMAFPGDVTLGRPVLFAFRTRHTGLALVLVQIDERTDTAIDGLYSAYARQQQTQGYGQR